MTQHRQPVCRREPGRARANDRHGFPRACCAGERMPAFGHQHISRIALQPANFDRFALGGFADTGLFAQGFGRADPGAHAPQNVLAQDGSGGRFGRTGGDLANEQWNVDGRGAGRDARGVVAEITAVGGHRSLVGIQRRVQIGEVGGNLIGRQSTRYNPWGRHRRHWWLLGLAPLPFHLATG